MTYPTLANLKTVMDVPGAGQDAELEWAVDAAIAWFEDKTGRVFVDPGSDAQVSFPVVYPHVRGRVLAVGMRDLQTITTITNGSGVAVASTDYYTRPLAKPFRQIILRREKGIVWTGSGGNDIVIDGRWCYSTACPDDVFQAILQLGQLVYLTMLSGPLAVDSQMGATTIKKDSIPSYVMDVVKDRRRL